MTVLIWTQHLLGTGHLRRSLALAAALADRDVPVLLASGGAPTRLLAPTGVEFIQLDPVHAEAGDFARLHDSNGRPWTERAAANRAAKLVDVVTRLRPKTLVTELFPFGRSAFHRELLPLIEAVRAVGGRVVCSVRDILVDKDPARTAVMADLALRHFDLILVHGDERFLPFAATFPDAYRLGNRLLHTGFVIDRSIEAAKVRCGILVSAGGGRVGARLLAAAAAAGRQWPNESWDLVGGAALEEAAGMALAAILGPAGRVHAHLDDLPERLASCRLSISQAGYNTVVEALMGRAPMVLVPFAPPGETEQRRRAQRLVELGRAVVVDTADLTSTLLLEAGQRAMQQNTEIGRNWSFDGAAVGAAAILDLCR